MNKYTPCPRKDKYIVYFVLQEHNDGNKFVGIGHDNIRDALEVYKSLEEHNIKCKIIERVIKRKDSFVDENLIEQCLEKIMS